MGKFLFWLFIIVVAIGIIGCFVGTADVLYHTF